MPSIFALFRRRAVSLSAGVFLALAAMLLAALPATAPEVIVGAPFEYTRSVRKPDGTVTALQTAIRRFTPVSGTGPTVYLVAATHIAEKTYYRKLQAFLNKQDVVLYEGISARRRTTAAPGKTKRPKRRANGLYRVVADLLNLSMQQDEVRYHPPQFQHSDLSLDHMERLAKKDGPATSRKMRQEEDSLSEFDLAEIDKVREQFRRNPALAKAYRNDFVQRRPRSDPRRREKKVQRSCRKKKRKQGSLPS